ncbi:SDR family NAD(P)-dependent oxidoreductase [Gracilinema caldarium]|uniref:Short-chain dehydrogenase/reductase SDR n=1 Tax=Gracilinema caldarium (strain ATCC 51460 / DSM 7334 / H1) TaxID=744872 RepID=F8EYG9_GRAC1|nr:SDR family oxidoreductase [Gracilinema caldarium]AEJ18401.1 short-chain dehydrogenase/reductase SDR [Gracilinema caldarium DSM 7334]
MDTFFSNRSALVIGGSGGIGKAVTLALAAAGAQLYIHGGHSRSRLENTLQEVQQIQMKQGCPLEQQQHRILLQPITGSESVPALLKFAPEVDILVCAYGPFFKKDITHMTAEDWDYLVTMNLALPGALVSAYLESMIQQAWGRILLFGGTNTDSIRGFTTTTAYSAAKTGLGVLAKSVARIGGSVNVTCNVICPGMTETEYLDEQARRYALGKAPGGILLQCEDIAETALAILHNPHQNGTIIALDKGLVI